MIFLSVHLESKQYVKACNGCAHAGSSFASQKVFILTAHVKGVKCPSFACLTTQGACLLPSSSDPLKNSGQNILCSPVLAHALVAEVQCMHS